MPGSTDALGAIGVEAIAEAIVRGLERAGDYRHVLLPPRGTTASACLAAPYSAVIPSRPEAGSITSCSGSSHRNGFRALMQIGTADQSMRPR